MKNYQDMDLEELETERVNTFQELQRIDRELAQSAADVKLKAIKKSEIADETKWRLDAIENKQQIVSELQLIKKTIKEKNTEKYGEGNNYGNILKDISAKMDKIISLMEQK